MKAQITRKALIVIVALGTLIAACSPEKIVTSNSKIEQQARTWVQETCHKSNGIDCDTMGQ